MTTTDIVKSKLTTVRIHQTRYSVQSLVLSVINCSVCPHPLLLLAWEDYVWVISRIWSWKILQVNLVKTLCSVLLETVTDSGLLTQLSVILVLNADKLNPTVFVFPQLSFGD